MNKEHFKQFLIVNLKYCENGIFNRQYYNLDSYYGDALSAQALGLDCYELGKYETKSGYSAFYYFN